MGGSPVAGREKNLRGFRGSRSQLLGIWTARIELQNENQTQGKATTSLFRGEGRREAKFSNAARSVSQVRGRVADPGKPGTVGKLSFWAIDCAVWRSIEVKEPEAGVTAHHANRSCQLLVEMKVSRSAPRP